MSWTAYAKEELLKRGWKLTHVKIDDNGDLVWVVTNPRALGLLKPIIGIIFPKDSTDQQFVFDAAVKQLEKESAASL